MGKLKQAGIGWNREAIFLELNIFSRQPFQDNSGTADDDDDDDDDYDYHGDDYDGDIMMSMTNHCC